MFPSYLCELVQIKCLTEHLGSSFKVSNLHNIKNKNKIREVCNDCLVQGSKLKWKQKNNKNCKDWKLKVNKKFQIPLYKYKINTVWFENIFHIFHSLEIFVIRRTSIWPNLILITLPAPCFSVSCMKLKISLNIYFYTSFWRLKRFYEGLHQIFWGTTKRCENKNSS